MPEEVLAVSVTTPRGCLLSARRARASRGATCAHRPPPAQPLPYKFVHDDNTNADGAAVWNETSKTAIILFK